MIERILWSPHLEEMLGGDKTAKDKVNDMFTLLGSLEDNRFNGPEKARIMDMIAGMDSLRLMFSVPVIMRCIRSSCKQLSERTMYLLEELSGGFYVRVMNDLSGIFRSQVVSRNQYIDTINFLESEIVAHKPLEKDLPMSGLISLRKPIFLLSMWNMILDLTRKNRSYEESFQTFIEDADARQRLFERLSEWANDAPIYLRSLVIQWIGSSGISPDQSIPSFDFLKKLYIRAYEPVTAGISLIAMSELAVSEKNGIETANYFLEQIATLSGRFISFGRSDNDGTRIIFASLICALGRLSQSHPSSEIIPKKFTDTITMEPSTYLSLYHQEWDDYHKKSILRTAIILFRENIVFEVRPFFNQKQKKWFARPGFKSFGLSLIDTKGLISINDKKKAALWVRAKITPGVIGDPLKLQFEAVGIVEENHRFPIAKDLRELISPVLKVFCSDDIPSKFTTKLRNDIANEIGQRGLFMRVALHEAIQILARRLREEKLVSEAPWSNLLDFSARLGAGTLIAGFDSKNEHLNALSNEVRNGFLSFLGSNTVFSFIFPENTAEWPFNQFLVNLCMTVVRRTFPDGDVSFNWVERNKHALNRIATGNVPHTISMPANLVLQALSAYEKTDDFQLENSNFDPIKVFKLNARFSLLMNVEQIKEVYAEFFKKDIPKYRMAFIHGAILIYYLKSQKAPPEQTAAYLLENRITDNFLKMRLLSAYASCESIIGENTVRLLHYLLKTANSAQWNLYLYKRTSLIPLHEDKELLARIVRMIDENLKIGFKRTTQILDTMTLVDYFMSERLFLRTLTTQAAEYREFQYEYFRIRHSTSIHRETPTVMPMHGKALDVEPNKLWIPFLADAHSLDNNENSIASYAGNCVSSFVWRPKNTDEFKGIVKYYPLGKNAVDFFSFKESAEPKDNEKAKEKWLKDNLDRENNVQILGRIKEIRKNGSVLVDLGVEMDLIQRKQELYCYYETTPDEPVIVDVRKQGQGLPVMRCRTEIVENIPNEKVVNLINHSNRSEYLKLHKEVCPIFLKGVVKKILSKKDDKTICHVSAGFLLQTRAGKKIDPIIDLYTKESVNVGMPIVLSIPWYELIDEPQPPYRIEIPKKKHQRFLPGLVTGAFLGSKKKYSGGIRSWYGKIGAHNYKLDRSQLTTNLATISGLDQADDISSFIKEIYREPVTVRIQEGERSISVIEAPPKRDAMDLTIALAGGWRGSLNFVRKEQNGQYLVFELCPELADGIPELSFPWKPIGEFVRIFRHDLFDRKLQPVSIKKWKERLSFNFQVKNFSAGEDGCLIDHSHSDDLSMKRSPRLIIQGIPNDSALKFHQRFQKGESLNVKMVKKSPEIRLTLDETEKKNSEYPFPEIVISPKEPGKVFSLLKDRNIGDNLDLEIARGWDPFSERNIVEVKAPEAFFIPLGYEPETKVRRLINLKPKCYFHFSGNYKYNSKYGTLSIDGMQFYMDPLTHAIIPVTMERSLNYPDIKFIVTNSSEKVEPLQLEDKSIHVPFLEMNRSIKGLIVRTLRDPSSPAVDVRWLNVKSGKDEYEISDIWTLKPNPGVKFFTGDLLKADFYKNRLNFRRIKRNIQLTHVHEFLYWEDWFNDHGKPGKIYNGILITKEDESDNWIFCLEPRFIVSVPKDRINNIEYLNNDGIWTLDYFTFIPRAIHGDNSPMFLEVQDVSNGKLHSLHKEPFYLEGVWIDKKNNQLSARMYCEKDNKMKIPVQMSRDMLPGPLPVRGKPQTRYSLSGYTLNLEKIRSDEIESAASMLFSLEPHLELYRDGIKSKLRQKRTLIEAMENKTLLEADGITKAIGNALGVYLYNFEHPSLLPLPLSEQSWLWYGPEPISPGVRTRYTIFRNSNGEIIASLRRIRPLTIEEFFDKKGLAFGKIEHWELYYKGPCATGELHECGLHFDLEKDDMDTEWILFEVHPHEEPGLSIVIRRNQLLFMGESFDPEGLRKGDRITRFEVVKIEIEHKIETGSVGIKSIVAEEVFSEMDAQESKERYVLNILNVFLDIVHQLDSFTQKNGVLFARVHLEGRKVILNEVGGMDYTGRFMKPTARKMWQLKLIAPNSSQLEWLENLEQDEMVYVKWERADEQNHILYFRLLSSKESFALHNLVYVRSLKLERYGPSAKLVVEPLNKSHGGIFFIPDSVFSIRRGVLIKSIEKGLEGPYPEGSIFLSQVEPRENRQEGEIALSLIDNPERRFSYLMNDNRWVIVVQKNDEDFLVGEVSPGVKVRVPKNRIRTEKTMDYFDTGTILFLSTDQSKYLVHITGVVASNWDYLPSTVLTQWWGTMKYRENKKSDNKPLQSNIVGLPQLSGETKSVGNFDDNIIKSEIISQKVISKKRKKHVQLMPGTAFEDEVGIITLKSPDRPELSKQNGASFPLIWDEITCLRENAEKLSEHLAALIKKRKNYLVIASRFDEQISLRKRHKTPFPMDYLSEVFDQEHILRCAVARVEEDGNKIILELSPGIYCELLSNRISALKNAPLEKDMMLYWGYLRSGDILEIERSGDKISERKAYLPPCFVRKVIPSKERAFSGPYITMATCRADVPLTIGVYGPNVLQPPDVRLNLHTYNNKKEREYTLYQYYLKYGARLVLLGRIVNSIQKDNSHINFIDVGIDKFEYGKSPVCHTADPLTIGTFWPVRILNAQFDKKNKLKNIFWQSENESRYFVRGFGWRVEKVNKDNIQPGDKVIVYGDSEKKNFVYGYEDYRIHWAPLAKDPLKPHTDKGLKTIYDEILSPPGAVIWATVESIDQSYKRLTLSRRLQLENISFREDKIIRARLIKVLDNQHLLIDIMGVPQIIHERQFIKGIPANLEHFKNSLTAELGDDGIEIEIHFDQDGRIRSEDIYRPSIDGEHSGSILFTGKNGVLAEMEGHFIHIPGRELAWANLDDDSIKNIFKNREITVLQSSRTEIDRTVYNYSHIWTSAIKKEFDILTNSKEPVFVKKVWENLEQGKVLVRGTSGLIMELDFNGQEIPTRTVAYFQKVDHRNNRVILSLVEQIPVLWDIPAIDDKFVMDKMTPWTVRERMEILNKDLNCSDWKSVSPWIFNQEMLSPIPRNLRLFLEIIFEHAYGDVDKIMEPPWHLWAANSYSSTTFCSLIQQTATILAGMGHKADMDPCALFGVGYWKVLQHKWDEAIKCLNPSLEDLSKYLDSSFIYAYACHQNGDKLGAVNTLNSLLKKVWTNAYCTIPFIPIGPTIEKLKEKWQQSFESGDLDQFKSVIQSWQEYHPSSLDCQSQKIGLALAGYNIEDDFNQIANDYLEELRDSIYSNINIDPRHLTIATKLHFAKGDILRGWWYLDKIAKAPYFKEISPIVSFWTAWLSGNDEDIIKTDSFLQGLWSLLRQSGWRDKVDSVFFNNVFSLFRKTEHNLYFTKAECQLVDGFPEIEEEYSKIPVKY